MVTDRVGYWAACVVLFQIFSPVGLVAALWQTGGLVFGHHRVLWEVTDKVAYRAAACWVGPLLLAF